MISMYPCRIDVRGNIVHTYKDFDSFVFNERFQTTGDFQISSYDPETLFSMFPKNSLVCSSDSDAIMQCVKHEYSRDTTGTVKGVVSGVTPEAILKYRSAQPKVATIPSLDSDIRNRTWGDPKGYVNQVRMWDVFAELFASTNNNYYGRTPLKKLQIPFLFEFIDIPTYGGENASSPTFNRLFTPRTLTSYSISKSDTLYKVLEDTLKYEQKDAVVQRKEGVTGLNFVFRTPLYKADKIQFTRKQLLSETSSSTSETPNVFVSPTQDRVVVHDLGDEGVLEPELMGLNYRMVVREIDAYNPDGANYANLEKYYDDRVNIVEDRQSSIITGVEMNKSFVDNRFRFVKKRTKNTEFYEYDLGDVVAVDSAMNGLTEMIVSEYIRVQDTTGFKEYPVFKPFVTTDHLSGPGTIVTPYFKKVLESTKLYTWN